ncbi:unnamed protein product [Rotaria magnacalcarata]|uniref:G-protein coupled receptors family 1 profile domain-containing protein n=1 Tax=Rotaria magnacalcarata TaxID=392030 RepID=A0A816YR35_9BILA|nr:unnamed protein product [Rotaria magnacalcarata]CAF1684544.1 unnamed protein product [Rotaria magnacalcarata]CAF2160622.1 unnamed protein product [Rotaria magnacalcarata]CAF3890205.1 unnamed protein product [Rotaria magnacalcarata]CAF4006282.1 unnamed protein product [Rotaria magnacalcarata]
MAWSSQLESLYYIVIALTGLIGNTTTIIVFSQRRLRSLRSSFFLTCLAMTDLIFILILVIAFLHQLHVPVMTKPVCMLTIYLSHIASFLSSNFTLAYTLHRLIAVFFPIKATTFLKQRTNRILAFGLFIFACSFYLLSFPVTTTKLVSNATNIVYCEEDRDKPLLFPFLILDTLFTFIIPFSCITCMNLAIVYKLHSNFSLKQPMPISNVSTPALCPSAKSSTNSSGQSQTDAMELPILNNSNNNANYNTQSKRNPHCLRQQNHSFICARPIERHKRSRNGGSLTSTTSIRHISLYHQNTSIRIRSTQCRATASAKTTKMLLAASTVFLVFNLPYHSLLFCFLFTREGSSRMLHAVNIARLWFFASFCVNFFVYVICGQRFRSEVVRLFSCKALQRYFTYHSQAKTQERQNSIYLGHRLFRASSTHLSHSN